MWRLLGVAHNMSDVGIDQNQSFTAAGSCMCEGWIVAAVWVLHGANGSPIAFCQINSAIAIAINHQHFITGADARLIGDLVERGIGGDQISESVTRHVQHIIGMEGHAIGALAHSAIGINNRIPIAVDVVAWNVKNFQAAHSGAAGNAIGSRGFCDGVRGIESNTVVAK